MYRPANYPADYSESFTKHIAFPFQVFTVDLLKQNIQFGVMYALYGLQYVLGCQAISYMHLTTVQFLDTVLLFKMTDIAHRNIILV